MGRFSGDVAGDLGRVLRWGTATGDDDARLLERFRVDRDESAFTALVARHGPMVLGVCRRILRDELDAEDAFQATFLVLVRSAGAIRRGELAGPWIHGVARRVAVRARAVAARKAVRERSGTDAASHAVAPASHDPDRAEWRAILDAELARLPETLRAPLVLCYLEGLTHEQAAGKLRQPVGTIRSRLSRGRERLRARLARRGVSADDAALGSMLLAEPVPTALFESTVRSALEFTVPSTAATAVASASAAALAKGVLDAMLISKLKLTAACILGLILTTGGLSGYAFQQVSGEPNKQESSSDAEKSPESRPKNAADPPNAERLEKYLQSLETAKEQKAAELKTLEEQVGNQERHLQSMKYAKDVVSADIKTLEEQIAGISKRLGEIQDSESAKPHGITSRRPAPRSKPAEEAITEGPAKAEYLDPSKPIVVPSESGHVVTIFGLPNPQYQRMMGMMSQMNQMRSRAGRPGNPMAGAAQGDGRAAAMMGAMGGSPPKMYIDPQSVRLAKEGDPPLEVTPIFGSQSGISLMLRGEKVQQLAIFDLTQGRWVVQDLREPVKAASPVWSLSMTVYALGRRLYTYSTQAGRWSVLELPEGANPEGVANDRGLTLRYGDRVHIYNIHSGEWTQFDLKAPAPPPEESKDEEE